MTSNVQHQILTFIKQYGEASNAEIANHLAVSYEAARQQLRQLEAGGFVKVGKQRESDRPGRPTTVYALSSAGDHLFPKNYDELAIELFDTVAETLGPAAIRQILTKLTDDRVREWTARLEGKSLPERLELLKGIYLEGDLYTEIEDSGEELRLVEHNCPYLNVAARRPDLCSVTISTLTRLLGVRVTRQKRFQDGDGRCAFHLHQDQPIELRDFHFDFEEKTDKEHHETP